MAFVLFILVNAIFFLRPAEIYPDLASWPIYQVLILSCLVLSIEPALRQLSGESLVERPLNLFVICMLLAIVLSHLSRFVLLDAYWSSGEFLKVVIYYLLLVALIDSTARLQSFLFWLIVFVIAMTGLALLDFHGVIKLWTAHALQELAVNPQINPQVDAPSSVPRLYGTGFFNDPNDLAMILVTSIVISASWLMDVRLGLLRALWAVPIGFFLYALMMTQSRGGLLALAAALTVLFQARFGWGKSLVLAPIALGLLMVVFGGGRQTEFSDALSSDTGQSRVQLWSEALGLFREAPIFGIGANQFSERVFLVAHNSFLHSYAELGIFGGTVFLGAFVFAISTIYGFGSSSVQILDPTLKHFQPYWLAALVGCFVSLMSISRPYMVATYMMFGITTAFVQLVKTDHLLPGIRFNQLLVKRIVITSFVFLIGMYCFVRIMVNRGAG